LLESILESYSAFMFTISQLINAINGMSRVALWFFFNLFLQKKNCCYVSSSCCDTWQCQCHVWQMSLYWYQFSTYIYISLF